MSIFLATNSMILTGLITALLWVTVGPMFAIVIGLIFSFVSARIAFD
jgi:Na+-translocating ferredoxin:NAD+ oxidoreductase RnfD subunit